MLKETNEEIWLIPIMEAPMEWKRLTCHVYGPFEFRSSLGTSILLYQQKNNKKQSVNTKTPPKLRSVREATAIPLVWLNHVLGFQTDSIFLSQLGEVRWIGCLTSQSTIFQLYMWRHMCRRTEEEVGPTVGLPTP